MIAVEDNTSPYLATSTMARKSAAIGAKAELIEGGMRAGATAVLVAHAHRAMTCTGRRPRHACLQRTMRTIRCGHCGFTTGRDRNAAAVILAAAERIRGGVDDVRHLLHPSGAGLPVLSEPEIPRFNRGEPYKATIAPHARLHNPAGAIGTLESSC
jgi:putative transposase